MSTPIPAPPVVRSREITENDHPDKRPCPAWCWIVANNPDGYAHEIQDHRITTAVHTFEDGVNTRASLYEAETDHKTCLTTSATFESHLEQSGGAQPIVRVSLRSYPHVRKADGTFMKRHDYVDRMKLTVEDARELAAALTYLADIAEAGS